MPVFLGFVVLVSAVFLSGVKEVQAAQPTDTEIVTNACKNSVSGTDQQQRCEANLQALCTDGQLGPYFKGAYADALPDWRAMTTIEACVQGSIGYFQGVAIGSGSPTAYKITQDSVCNLISGIAKSGANTVKSDCFAAMGSGDTTQSGDIKFDTNATMQNGVRPNTDKSVSVQVGKGTLAQLGIAIGATATAPAPPPVVPGQDACNSKYTADISTNHFGFPDEKATRDDLRSACTAGAGHATDAKFCSDETFNYWPNNQTSPAPDVRDLLISACLYGQRVINPDASSDYAKAQCNAVDGREWDDTTDPPRCRNLNGENTDTTTTDQEDPCETNAAAFGWILCPLIVKADEAVQDLFQNVITALFQYQDATDPTVLTAWQRLLPVANIAFVILFLIIIYSTATSTGMSNYSVKKILPRLVIGAILVNISFYICVALADLSNIAGAYIGNMIANTAYVNPVPNIATIGLASIAIIILVAIAWPTILLSLVLILVLVTLRRVALTLLIVISPIAFALWLLPNTKKWFDMWLKEYTRMLLIYPAISAVFGASMLASTIVGTTTNPIFATIMKALLILVPVIAILPIMKMGGQAMAKLQGMVQKGINRAGGDALRKNQQERVKDWGGRRIAGVKNRMRRGVETASNEVEAAQKSLATAQGNRARAATKFGENEQKELAGLAALVVRNRAQQERFDELTGFQNEANVADREVKTAENNLAAKQQAHKDKLRGRGYRLAFYNDMVRAQRSERERQQKAQSMRALGDRIGLEAGQGESSSWMRSYTGMGKAEKSRALGAREDAYNTQTEIEDKESSERTQRELSRLGNFKIDDNGIDRVLSNEEIADLLTGKRASITGKIGDRTITIGGEELAGNRNQKLAMIKTLQDHGWASSEVLKVQDAIAKQSDGYVRQAMQDAVAQSGKAESWYAGGAIPGVSNGKVRSVEDGVVYSTQGGIKGDIFGASVGGNQTVKMAEAIRRMAAARPAAGTAQANAIQQTGAYIESQLNSNNGGNVINSDPKAADVYSMLQSANRSEADIAAMFKRAGMSNARFAQVQAMAAQRTTEGRNLNLSLYN